MECADVDADPLTAEALAEGILRRDLRGYEEESGHLRTVILVPYRPDNGRRDELWTFTRAWLEKNHPDYPVFIGKSPDGLFNRSAAINDASRQAGDWDVAVICDSDTVVLPLQFEEAVREANATGRLTSALTNVIELTRESTDRLLAGEDLDIRKLKKIRTRTRDDLTQSSVIAVPRSLWDAIGGFDEEFCGWGCEDNAFWKAATIFGATGDPQKRRKFAKSGKPFRVDGSAYHLWHEQASKIKMLDPVFRKNFWRLRHYKKSDSPRELELLRNS